MKRFILLLLILSAQVFAQFNPTLFEDEITRKGYSVDLNGTDEFSSVTPSLRLTGKYSLRDDFSVDGMTGVANRGWVVGSGSYTVNNLVDNPLSANDYALVCQTAGVISIPCNQSAGRWSFDLYKGADGNTSSVYFISSAIATYTGSYGYWYYFGINENSVFAKANSNGAPSNLSISANSYISNSTWYRVTIERNTNGVTSVYLNNVLVSTTGGSGTNPVTDNTYTTSNYFVLDLDANDRISNIQCEYGEGSLDLNSFEMILHSDSRDFETSKGAWAAHGNHTIYRSSAGKRSGTYALAISSSGAGDSTTNYVDLPISAFVRKVNGSKYTYELWAKDSSLTNTTLSLAIGDKKNSFANVNGTYAKKVFSYQATSATVGQTIRVYLNQATTVYLDDFSLTRFYPTSISGWFKTGSAAQQVVLSKTTGNVASTSLGYVLRIESTGIFRMAIYNETPSALSPETVSLYGDNKWHYFTFVADLPACSLFVDNETITITYVAGKSNNIQNYTVGAYSFNNSVKWNGQLGELQHLKDYAKTQAEHLAEYRSGIKRRNEEMIRIKWRGSTDAEMLRDHSGSGNSLSGTNLTQSGDQQKGTYKAK